MKKVCDYCNSQYDDTLEKCPNCGAPNDNVRKANGVPTTIEELKKWYEDHHLPPEDVTRFFIGKNLKEPKAFGIYKDDSGDFVVYKNKADGQRAVRYKGGDESYAVNELYQKLKDEIARQKAGNKERRSGSGSHGVGKAINKAWNYFWYGFIGLIFLGYIGAYSSIFQYTALVVVPFVLFCAYKAYKNPAFNKKNIIRNSIIAIVIAVIISLFGVLMKPANKDGYYAIDGNTYYSRDDSWYAYDYGIDDWYYLGSDPYIDSDSEYTDYYEGSFSYSDDSIGTSFTDSDYYEENFSSSDSDWDSDSDWGSDDSWDSGGSDWDSDW